jgi:hypothetical protein
MKPVAPVRMTFIFASQKYIRCPIDPEMITVALYSRQASETANPVPEVLPKMRMRELFNFATNFLEEFLQFNRKIEELQFQRKIEG